METLFTFFTVNSKKIQFSKYCKQLIMLTHKSKKIIWSPGTKAWRWSILEDLAEKVILIMLKYRQFRIKLFLKKIKKAMWMLFWNNLLLCSKKSRKKLKISFLCFKVCKNLNCKVEISCAIPKKQILIWTWLKRKRINKSKTMSLAWRSKQKSSVMKKKNSR